jgi:hypothetical protein
MTQARRDNHSTEFGLWLRNQGEIDSGRGFTASNVDYVWQNYKTGEWMLIEEKRFKRWPQFPQTKLFEILHAAIKDSLYRGFHYLVFENTSPNNGRIFLKSNFTKTRELTAAQLLDFLRFDLQPEAMQPDRIVERSLRAVK